MKSSILLVAVLGLFFTACKNGSSESESTNAAVPAPTELNYSVMNIYPHDTTSFTEGLLWMNEHLYESTGLNGESGLIKAKLETGKAVQKIALDNAYFGEGISIINNKIYQLTYTEHKVFVYDMNFKKLPEEFAWPYEGWGMTTDGTHLIISTGGNNLFFVNPENFKIEKTLSVINNNGYVDSINELEYVDGYVYANIWRNNYIIKINLKTGLVEGRADLSNILEKNNFQKSSRTDVLNGIAYNSAKKSFYITGKYWPAMFEVKFN